MKPNYSNSTCRAAFERTLARLRFWANWRPPDRPGPGCPVDVSDSAPELQSNSCHCSTHVPWASPVRQAVPGHLGGTRNLREVLSQPSRKLSRAPGHGSNCGKLRFWPHTPLHHAELWPSTVCRRCKAFSELFQASFLPEAPPSSYRRTSKKVDPDRLYRKG